MSRHRRDDERPDPDDLGWLPPGMDEDDARAASLGLSTGEPDGWGDERDFDWQGSW